jgi:autotransporter-associated beta strand protein
MRLSKSSLAAAAGLLAFSASASAEALTGGLFFTNSPENYRVIDSVDYYTEFNGTYYLSDMGTPTSSGAGNNLGGGNFTETGETFQIRDAKDVNVSVLQNVSGAPTIVVDKGATLTLNASYSTTFNGTFFGEGNLVKNGTGSLQYNGFSTTSGSLYGLNDPAPTTHPGYGYFRNANNIAVADVLNFPYFREIDPRSPNYETSEYVTYLYQKNVFFAMLVGGSTMVSRNGEHPELLTNLPLSTSYAPHWDPADATTVNVSNGPVGTVLQLGNEPYAKLLTGTRIYNVSGQNAAGEWLGESTDVMETDLVWRDAQGNLYNPATAEDPTVSVAPGYIYRIRQPEEGSVGTADWFYPISTIFHNGDNSESFGGLSGTLTINSGELDVKGYLTHWREFPGGARGTPWSYDALMMGADKPAMVGVKEIVLTGSAKLTFRNSELNITDAALVYDHPEDTGAFPDPHTPNTIALNYVHNLMTGRNLSALSPDDPDYVAPVERVVRVAARRLMMENGVPVLDNWYSGFGGTSSSYVWEDVPEAESPLETSTFDQYSNDQHNTQLEIGVNDNSHRVIIHQDLYVNGSVGRILGSGRIAKTGPGTLTILNKAETDGTLHIAGGQLILDPQAPASGTGQTLLENFTSVNLVGTDGVRGTYIAPDIRAGLFAPNHHLNYTAFESEALSFKMGYAPAPEVGFSEEVWLRQLAVVDPVTGAPQTQQKMDENGLPLYVVDPETGVSVPDLEVVTMEVKIPMRVDKSAQLVLHSNQTIRNFQALFAESSGPTDAIRSVESAIIAAQKANPTEIYIAGQGIGTNVQLNSFRLSIKQEEGADGVYRGSINADWVAAQRDQEIATHVQAGVIPVVAGGNLTAAQRLEAALNIASSWQNLKAAKALILEKRDAVEKTVSPAAARYYDTLLEQLNKIGEAEFGQQGAYLETINLAPQTALELLERNLLLEAVNLAAVDNTRINSAVLYSQRLVMLTRDDYVQYNLAVESQPVAALYTFLFDEQNTNNTLEVVAPTGAAALPPKPVVPKPEDFPNVGDYEHARSEYEAQLKVYNDARRLLCYEVLDGVFSNTHNQVNLEEAKRLLGEGLTMIAKGYETGNTYRYNTILDTIARGDTSEAKRLFISAGSIEKLGAGKLAFLVNSANLREIVVSEGALVANVQALAYSTVNITDGTLRVLQNTTGTLNATIEGPSRSTLVFTTRDYITNTSGQEILVGEDAAGTVVVNQRQDKFLGNVIVEEGVTLQLSSTLNLDGVVVPDALNDSFANTNSFTLRGGESQRATTLSINGSDQRIRNFSGDTYGRVLLGSGILVLNQEFDHAFDGKIYGQGAFVKEGQGVFSLGGVSEFYGAAVIREGILSLGAANAFNYASALVLKAGATVNTNAQPQRIGALFGEKDSVLSIGSGGLTVGFTDQRLAQLQIEDAAGTQGLMNMDYLGTWSRTNEDGSVEYNFKNPGALNNVRFDPVQSSRATSGSTIGFLASDLVGLDNAADLAFSGAIVGTGDLIKIGKERLTLDGYSPNYSGTTRIDQGVLQLNADSLNSSVVVINTVPNSDLNYLEINAPGGKTLLRTGVIRGTGDLHKIGKGEAVLDLTSYTGTTWVDQGRLVITDVAGLPGRSDANPSGGVRVNNTSTLVLSYSGAEVVSYAGLVSGTGGLEKTGTGKVRLTGALNYGFESTTISDGRELYSTSITLPAGSTREGNIVRFPIGSRYNSIDGTISLSLDPNETPYIPTNLKDIVEVQVDGQSYVEAVPTGLLIVRNDGLLIPVAGDVIPAPAGATLRDNGTLVTADGQRISTYGGVINFGDDWAGVWKDGEQVSGISLFLDPDAYLVADQFYNGAMRDWLTQSQRSIIRDADGTVRTVTNGTTVVFGGELEVTNLPKPTAEQLLAGQTAGAIEIGAVATFTANLSTNETLLSEIIGAGTFNKAGAATLVFAAAQDNFTGVVNINGGKLGLTAENALKNTRYVTMASDTELILDGKAQSLHYLTGDESSTVRLGGSALTLDVAVGIEGGFFRGWLTGDGHLIKQGEGTFSLWRPAAGPVNNLTSISVENGLLQVSPTALGNADVNVLNGAELAFYTETGEFQNYTGKLSGTGIIGKDGAGVVHLEGNETLLDVPDGKTQFLVREGRLIVDNTRIGGDVVPGALVKTGATFQLNLVESGKYLTLSKDIVRDYTPADHGSLAIQGADGTSIVINGTPLGYTGVTELVGGLMLTFNLDPALYSVGSTALLEGGLRAERPAVGISTPLVNVGGGNTDKIVQDAVKLVQNIESEFWGDFIGNSAGAEDIGKTDYGPGSGLVIAGPEKFIYMGSDGRGKLPEGNRGENNAALTSLALFTGDDFYNNRWDMEGLGVGKVTVNGGKLQVGVANEHTIDLVNGGTLYIANYTAEAATYDGFVTNVGLVPSDAGTAYNIRFLSPGGGAVRLSGAFLSQLPSGHYSAELTVEAGSTLGLDVKNGDGDLNALFKTDKFAIGEGGTLEVNVALNGAIQTSVALTSSIVGTGNLVKVGAGRLDVNAAQQYTGSTFVREGVLGGNFSVTGDLVIGSTEATAPTGIVSPGNSPGDIGVGRDVVLNKTGRLEVEIENGVNDTLTIGRSLVLNGGVISISGFGDGIQRGSVFLLAKSAVPGTTLNIQWLDTPSVENGGLSAPNSNDNFILLGPGVGSGTPYEKLATQEGLSLLVAQKQLSRVAGLKVRDGLGGFLPALDFVATLQVPHSTGDEDSALGAYDAWYDANRASGNLALLRALPRDRAAALFASIVGDYTGAFPTSVRGRLNDPDYKAVHDWLGAAYAIGAFVNTTAVEGGLARVIEGFSPQGYASLAAMPAAAASAGVDQIRARTEQRRYDHGQFITEYKWQAYVAGATSIVKNGSGSDSASFDFNNSGGLVGADVLVADRTLIGAAVEYTNGSASLDNGGGKMKMNSARATAYFSRTLDRGGWFHLDAGASAGYASYDATRNTALGSASADPNGWNAGAFATLGTALALYKLELAGETRHLNLAPFAGIEYNHFSIGGFSEDGGDSTLSHLKVDAIDFDSLRVKVGTGLHWTWGDFSSNWRIGLEFAYARELLDTDAEISSRFVLDPFRSTRNTIKAHTLSGDVVQVSPSVTWGINEQTSIFASYRWETSFDGATQHNINVGFRYRF